MREIVLPKTFDSTMFLRTLFTAARGGSHSSSSLVPAAWKRVVPGCVRTALVGVQLGAIEIDYIGSATHTHVIADLPRETRPLPPPHLWINMDASEHHKGSPLWERLGWRRSRSTWDSENRCRVNLALSPSSVADSYGSFSEAARAAGGQHATIENTQ